MAELDLSTLLVFGGGFFCALALGYWAAGRPLHWPRRRASSQPSETSNPILLFDRGCLVDANPAALKLLGNQDPDALSWQSVREALVHDLPDLPDILGNDAGGIRFFPENAIESEPRASLEEWDQVSRLVLHNWSAENATDAKIKIRGSELAALRRAAQMAPFPIWQTDQKNQLIWYNDSYKSTIKPCDFELLLPVRSGTSGQTQPRKTYRAELKDGTTNEKRHFEIAVVATHKTKTYYALDASAIMQAENAQRRFVQTLSKTFAQLSVGLAIFNKEKRLVVFNPALIDLLDIPVEQLSSRPSFEAFFDLLRENRVLPEPKDYFSWRTRLTDLVIDASQDRYCETWQLPSGANYRVTGRPHPDGAIAFIFEDISAEISLTRRFKRDLEINQAILDQLDEAIVVVSQSGQVTNTNRAFRSAWKIDPDGCFAQFTLRDLAEIWRQECTSDHFVTELKAKLASTNRKPWSAQVETVSGLTWFASMSPLPDGAIMIRFKPYAPSSEAAIKEIFVA
jgi:PAS domain-containing protein